jgi:hypothetical protein
MAVGVAQTAPAPSGLCGSVGELLLTFPAPMRPSSTRETMAAPKQHSMKVVPYTQEHERKHFSNDIQHHLRCTKQNMASTDTTLLPWSTKLWSHTQMKDF